MRRSPTGKERVPLHLSQADELEAGAVPVGAGVRLPSNSRDACERSDVGHAMRQRRSCYSRRGLRARMRHSMPGMEIGTARRQGSDVRVCASNPRYSRPPAALLQQCAEPFLRAHRFDGSPIPEGTFDSGHIAAYLEECGNGLQSSGNQVHEAIAALNALRDAAASSNSGGRAVKRSAETRRQPARLGHGSSRRRSLQLTPILAGLDAVDVSVFGECRYGKFVACASHAVLGRSRAMRRCAKSVASITQNPTMSET